MHFDLTDLRLFLAVLHSGSITGGAAAAGLALASASARLRGMEDQAGLPLLERGRRGVRPTPAGDALAHHARLVLRQMDGLRGELRDFAGGLRGRVRLAGNTAAVSEFLPDALAPWLARHPGLDLVLTETTSPRVIQALLAGEAELGLHSGAVAAPGLQSRPFAIDRLVAVLPRGHALAGRRSLGFSEVPTEALVGLPEGSPLQALIEEQARLMGRSLSYRLRLPGFAGLARLVAAGVGLAIMPEMAARALRRGLPLAVLRLTDAWATRPLLLTCRDFATLPRPARLLAEHLSPVPSQGGRAAPEN